MTARRRASSAGIPMSRNSSPTYAIRRAPMSRSAGAIAGCSAEASSDSSTRPVALCPMTSSSSRYSRRTGSGSAWAASMICSVPMSCQRRIVAAMSASRFLKCQ
ncbi:hypothetical protein [Stackebrandtia nassauensis]|nr:hypothetical protein [Stackebrandtia nassauensis]